MFKRSVNNVPIGVQQSKPGLKLQWDQRPHVCFMAQLHSKDKKKKKNLCYKKKLSAENISKLSKVVLIYNWSGFHDIHSITPLVVEVLFLPAAVAGPGFFNLQGEEIS